MTGGHQWECWTLSIEDIREAAKRVGVPAERLSADDCFEIASRFKKGMAWAMDDWLEMLKETVEQVWKKNEEARQNQALLPSKAD